MSQSVQIPPNWKAGLDKAIGAPPTPALDEFENTWFDVEHGDTGLTGGFDQGGRYNPFDTTLKVPGSTSYNAAGVQNYPSATVGIEATAATLEEPAYRNLLSEMRSGHASLAQLEDAENASPWGSAFSSVPEDMPAPGTGAVPANLDSIKIPSQFFGGLAGTNVKVPSPLSSISGGIGTVILEGLFIAIGGALVVAGGYKAAGKPMPAKLAGLAAM